MNKLVCVALALTLGVALAQTAPKVDGVIGAKEYANSAKIEDSGITLNWQIAGDTVYFAFSGPAKTWVGLGFNPTGDKKEGADMYMFIFDKGKMIASDMIQTKSKGEPKADDKEGGKNNILASAGIQKGDTVTVEFSRKLNTGDKTDTVLTAGKSAKVLLATSSNANPTKAHSKKDRWEQEIVLK